MKHNERELIAEAEKRGYKTGTLVDYEGNLPGTDTLGSGEFELRDGRLIKYEEKRNPKTNPYNRRYDQIWSERDGWTKIANKKHGFAL